MWGTRGRSTSRAALVLVAATVLLATACQKRNDVPYGEGLPDQVLDIYYPDEPEPDMPVVVWIHGGGYTGGCEQAPGYGRYPDEEAPGIPTVEDCLTKTPNPMYWSPVDLVDDGAVVVSVRYRLAGTPIPGDGDGDGTVADGETRPARHRDLVRDVDQAIRWVRGGGIQSVLPTLDVDTDKLVAWGWSAGANLAAHQALGTSGPAGAPAEVPDRLILFAGSYQFTAPDTRAFIDGSPFLDDVYRDLFGCRSLGGAPSHQDPACQDEIVAGSTVHESQAGADFPPTLISHGQGDGMVPPVESQRLAFVLTLGQVPVTVDAPACMNHDMLDVPVSSSGACLTPPTDRHPGYDEQLVHDTVFADW